ncbi:transposable element Tc1 transposase [Trichonephila clavipes]|nr:transposable element Tc1 transposase [Trichonephila clavipes]
MHRTASAEEIPFACTIVTQRTVRNRLLQTQLQARHLVARIPLTLSRLRRQWCQARDHWKMEWRSVEFSDESRICLGASNDRVFVRGRPEECVQPNCLWLRHTGPTPGVMIWRAISYNSRITLVVIPNILIANLNVSLAILHMVLPFISSIQGGVFE